MKRELIDRTAPHKFNQFIARWSKTGKEDIQKKAIIKKGEIGPVYGSLTVSTRGTGCLQITQEIILYDKIKRIDISNRVLRDSTPLLEHYFAFPFLVENPKIKFESTCSVIEPLKDQLPGSNTDYYTMQNWASVHNEEIGITFSGIEAPIVEFGGLRPGYVSSAHHCVTPKGYGHEFIKLPTHTSLSPAGIGFEMRDGFNKGHIYSYIMNNNFITNFKNTQVSDCLFRYSFTSHKGDWRKDKSYQFGWQIHNPLTPVCINGKGSAGKSTHASRSNRDKLRGKLACPLTGSFSFCRLDKPSVLLLTLKKAEDKNGFILRLIETEGKDTVVKITLPFLKIKKAYLTNLVEENHKRISAQKHIVKVPVKSFGITTIRIQDE